jgi:hypothetical protein
MIRAVPMARPLSLMAFFALVACDTSSSFSPSPCDVSLHQLKPTSALAGAEVIAQGRPFTSAYDTAVYVGDARATISGVERVRCDPCDECLEEQACTGCDDCDACDQLCSECFETVTFLVPETDPGDTVVTLFNRHGHSNALPFELLAPATDTGPTDTGPDDTGPTDTGSSDTGSSDTGPTDTGSSDTGPTDTGPTDSGSDDTGPGDSAPDDTATSPTDTASEDTSTP